MSNSFLCALVFAFSVHFLANPTLANPTVETVRILENSWYARPSVPSLGHYPGLISCYPDRYFEPDTKAAERCLINALGENVPAPTIGNAEPTSQFVYQIKIENTGQRTIRFIKWQYDFLDPRTGRVRESHSFNTAIRLPPGRTKTISEISVRPPTKIVDVLEAGIGSSTGSSEVTRIVSIEFDDH
jgi:hypothetical protein